MDLIPLCKIANIATQLRFGKARAALCSFSPGAGQHEKKDFGKAEASWRQLRFEEVCQNECVYKIISLG